MAQYWNKPEDKQEAVNFVANELASYFDEMRGFHEEPGEIEYAQAEAIVKSLFAAGWKPPGGRSGEKCIDKDANGNYINIPIDQITSINRYAGDEIEERTFNGSVAVSYSTPPTIDISYYDSPSDVYSTYEETVRRINEKRKWPE